MQTVSALRVRVTAVTIQALVIIGWVGSIHVLILQMCCSNSRRHYPKKRKEKTTPFSVSLTGSLVIYQAVQYPYTIHTGTPASRAVLIFGNGLPNSLLIMGPTFYHSVHPLQTSELMMSVLCSAHLRSVTDKLNVCCIYTCSQHAHVCFPGVRYMSCSCTSAKWMLLLLNVQTCKCCVSSRFDEYYLSGRETSRSIETNVGHDAAIPS